MSLIKSAPYLCYHIIQWETAKHKEAAHFSDAVNANLELSVTLLYKSLLIAEIHCLTSANLVHSDPKIISNGFTIAKLFETDLFSKNTAMPVALYGSKQQC